MRKNERQHTNSPNQSAVRQGSGGTAFESPEGTWIAELEAMQLNSPQAGTLTRFATMADSSPAMAAQRKLVAEINNSPRVEALRKEAQGANKNPPVTAQPKPREHYLGTPQVAETPSAKLEATRLNQSGLFQLHATAGLTGAIQCKILTKTHRSQPIKKLGATDWYKALPSDDHRAFAKALHREDTRYTKSEAEAEIQNRIDNGDPIPDDAETEKDKRKKRVREFVNSNAPQTSDTSYTRGLALSNASAHAHGRHAKKYKKRKEFKRNVKEINAVEPGLFANQDKVLSDSKDWEQIFALLNSAPQSYDFDLGGDKVTLDSIDIKANKERSKKRPSPRDDINLAQVFISQTGGNNSYWDMADNGDSSISYESAHKKLRHLEVERDPSSALTTYGKDVLLEQGSMDTKEAFGDEGFFAFQEYKGALDPSNAMRRMQMASPHHVLERALKSANRKLGTKVGSHELTTAKEINDALEAYIKDKSTANYRILIKEIFRLIRARTRMDLESDTESDEDYGSEVNNGSK